MAKALTQVAALNPKVEAIKTKLLNQLDKALPGNSPGAMNIGITTNGTTQWEQNGSTGTSSAFHAASVTLPNLDDIISIVKEIAKYSHTHRVDSSNSRK